MHGREVVVGIMQARIECNHVLEQLLRLLQAAAVMRAHAEQMHRVDMIRQRFQDIPAECFGLGISALAIGRSRGGEDGVRLFHQFLLQSRVLECARAAAAALQGVSPEDGPRQSLTDSQARPSGRLAP
ncbi:hypothetical protein ACVWWO_009598 [Bradyrhizobium sp. F1.13.1]